MPLGTIIIRFVLAIILGGLIGQERENKNRPAGFKTHILVCMGAAIVMTTSEYLFHEYKGQTNMDPARLGAQVISGIGFLGAGTIIKDGANVKGLTTAASLWSVACIGLAIGIGFYEGAIAGTIIIYITLIMLGRFGRMIQRKSDNLILHIEFKNEPGKIGEIGTTLGKMNVNIRDMELSSSDDAEDDILLKLTLKLPHGMSHEFIIGEISGINGIRMVDEY